MRKLICVVGALIYFGIAYGQYQSLAQWTGLAQNCGLQHPTILAALSNHAALADLKTAELFVASECKYGIAALTSIQAALASPVKNYVIGTAITVIGKPENSLMMGAIMVARHLNKIDVGIKINYARLATELYNPLNTVIPELAIVAHLNDKIGIGIKASNPSGNTWQTDYEIDKFPVAYSVAWSYKIATQVTCGVEIRKELHQTISFAVNLAYTLQPAIIFYTGIENNGNNFRMGAIWKKKQLQIGVTSDFHNTLGYTAGITILYKLKEHSTNKETV